MLVIQRPSVEAIDEEEGNRQRFAISPLEPGFGHTLGNSLRRTLLSSIPGAAITQVRFDDALHEFDTITGVTEDVTDIILNLKDLVVRQPQRRARHAAARRARPGRRHRRRHPDAPPTSRSSTPSLHIATLNGKGRLAVDLTIERGRGYLSADATRGSGTIGVIPVDSIFSPVRRVAFTVEPTRVEQSTNYDRLVLDIETDGSISPREALASAGATLRALVQLVEEMSDEPQGLELGEIAAPALSARPTSTCRSRTSTCPSVPATASSGPRSTPSASCSQKSEDDLLAITNFGQKSLDEVIEKLDERGLSLRGRRTEDTTCLQPRRRAAASAGTPRTSA